jgi:hypothetical protein
LTDKDYDVILDGFNKRYRAKKIVNLWISLLILLLGISSFCYGLRLEPLPLHFRFLTVDGTIFTTIGAGVFLIVNLVEMVKNTELTKLFVYYIRLSSAVAESIVFLVVFIAYLSHDEKYLPLYDRYDLFVMHVLIPILGIATFLINDSPIGKLTPLKRWNGTWFVAFYAMIMLILIGADILPRDLIPYPFLDFKHNWWGISVGTFLEIFGGAYLIGWFLSECNRKLSWLWFRGIAGNNKKKGVK